MTASAFSDLFLLQIKYLATQIIYKNMLSWSKGAVWAISLGWKKRIMLYSFGFPNCNPTEHSWELQ